MKKSSALTFNEANAILSELRYVLYKTGLKLEKDASKEISLIYKEHNVSIALRQYTEDRWSIHLHYTDRQIPRLDTLHVYFDSRDENIHYHLSENEKIFFEGIIEYCDISKIVLGFASALVCILRLPCDKKYEEMQVFFVEELIKNDSNKLLEKDALFREIRKLLK